MTEYTILGRKRYTNEKVVLVKVYSQYYADYWASIYRSEGWSDVKILVED